MFHNIFNRKEDSNTGIDKILLTDNDQLGELLYASKIKPTLLFKHSTSCGISTMVLKRFENDLQNKSDTYQYCFLDILKHKNISNLIAKEFNIVHQSPQLIVIKDGEVVDHASHFGIMNIEP